MCVPGGGSLVHGIEPELLDEARQGLEAFHIRDFRRGARRNLPDPRSRVETDGEPEFPEGQTGRGWAIPEGWPRMPESTLS